MDLELFSALGMWATGESVSGSFLYGIKIIWLGRIGKVMMASCLLVTLIDLYGPNRLRLKMLRALVVSRGYRKQNEGGILFFSLVTVIVYGSTYVALTIINAIAPKLTEKLMAPIQRWTAPVGSFLDRQTEVRPGSEKYGKRAHKAVEGVSGILLLMLFFYVVQLLDTWYVNSWWFDVLAIVAGAILTAAFFVLWGFMNVALANIVVRISYPFSFMLSDANLRRKTMFLTAVLFVVGFAMDIFAS